MKEKRIFSLVQELGEILTGELHIIDITERPAVEGEQKFRVYTSKGHCFDISKECVDEKKDGELIYDYVFLAEWEGFDRLDESAALNLITKLSENRV